MGGFPSGQREQTVNLSSMTSVVRIHHLPPKQKDIPKGMSFFCFGGRWLWIRKPALGNVPMARFNRRGLPVGRQPLKYLMVVPAAKRIHHRTGRHVAVRPRAAIASPGRRTPNPQERQVSTRPIRRKERSFDDEIYQHEPFVTIYCHLRRYPVGCAKSYDSWANTPTR